LLCCAWCCLLLVSCPVLRGWRGFRGLLWVASFLCAFAPWCLLRIGLDNDTTHLTQQHVLSQQTTTTELNNTDEHLTMMDSLRLMHLCSTPGLATEHVVVSCSRVILVATKEHNTVPPIFSHRVFNMLVSSRHVSSSWSCSQARVASLVSPSTQHDETLRNHKSTQCMIHVATRVACCWCRLLLVSCHCVGAMT